MSAVGTRVERRVGHKSVLRKWSRRSAFQRVRSRCRLAGTRSPSRCTVRKRSGRLLPGGDYVIAWNPHGTSARNLLLFVNLLGFTPMEGR